MKTVKTKKSLYVRSAAFRAVALCALSAVMLSGCADAIAPKARNVNIPAPKIAEKREKGINEKNADSVIYLPLGKDVLVPQSEASDPLPSKIVGPYELRGETLAGALQLVLDGTDIPVAFEAEDSLTKSITVTNLRGPLDSVVHELCSLGNMYCSYQNGMLVVKDSEIFTVTIPPITTSDNVAALLTNIAAAIGDITGSTPITDASTRTIVYRASQRTAQLAGRYFQRLRSSTALIVFETYVWEVSLDSGNTTGIKWSLFDKVGRFKFGVNISGSADTNVGTPISIGLPTTGKVDFDVNDVFQFVSSYGAVKTVSQPQITVLSGSAAKLRVADKQNYVSSLSRSTTDGGTTTVSTTTDSVDSGFTLNIGSNWDNSTVYGSIDILLQEVRRIDTFDENPDAVVQLPQTTERELQTQVRIRPGDLLLIAGLVREKDALDKEGLGLSEPELPFSRSGTASNTELVFLLRPRVVVFTPEGEATPRKSPVFASTAPKQAETQMDTQAATPVAPAAVLPAPVAATPAPVAAADPAPVASEPVQVQPVPVIANNVSANKVSIPVPEPMPITEMYQDTPKEEAKAAPVSVSAPAPVAAPAPEQSFSSVLSDVSSSQSTESTMTPVPDMVMYDDVAPENALPAVEINMPDTQESASGTQPENAAPSVIVNYDVLQK